MIKGEVHPDKQVLELLFHHNLQMLTLNIQQAHKKFGIFILFTSFLLIASDSDLKKEVTSASKEELTSVQADI